MREIFYEWEFKILLKPKEEEYPRLVERDNTVVLDSGRIWFSQVFNVLTCTSELKCAGFTFFDNNGQITIDDDNILEQAISIKN